MLALTSIKSVGVGSKNPVKIAAVEAVFTKMGLDVIVEGVDVPSGVSDMPSSIDETMQGSYNRAQEVLALGGFDLGIGLEGGIEFGTMSSGENVCWLFGWTSIVDTTGYLGQGSSGMFQVPGAVAFALEQGIELGTYMAEKTGIENIKQKGGTVGFLTNGLIPRQESFTNATITALIPWMHTALYE